jgi:hypothetical protein
MLVSTLLVFAGCADEPEPQSAPAAGDPRTAPGASEQAVPVPDLRLAEIRFLPAEGAPGFVELMNLGTEPVSLDAAILRIEAGAAVDLPSGLSIAPGATLVVRFDDELGADAGVVHRPAADFVGGEAGGVRLELPQGLADAVEWGEPGLGTVDLCRGGRCGAPRPGSVLARVPGDGTAFAPTAWALLDAALATPGSANPRPPVSAFAAMPGLIFTAEPRFSWYSVPGAARYRLEVASDETFASIVHETEVEATPGVRLEQFALQGPMLPPGEYAWRVQALGASGEAAEFSEAIPFSVDPTRAVPAAPGSAAESPPAGAAAPSRVPEGLLKVLDVPVLDHAKDTRMLVLEARSENPLWSWDTPDNASYPYCARAGVAMVNAYYRAELALPGKLSQDRIGYEAYRNLREGPEYDLPVVGIADGRTNDYSLPLALGTSGQYISNPYEGRGEDDDACYRYITSLALERCAALCADQTTDECFQCRLAREREITCPVEIAYPWRPDAIEWGTRTIVDFQREIDAGRPIIATNPGHLFLIVGYRLHDGKLFLFYQDEGGRREFQANALGLADYFDSYWLGLAPVKIGNDEPEIASDADGDGVVDFDEIHRFATDESKPDSDGDGVGDKEEIRASVWDPQHGYHISAATLAPTGDPEPAAARANLLGRDFDRDGLVMEIDPDSDGGGCRDGQEDDNYNGARDGRETYNFDRGDDEDCGVLGGLVKMAYDYSAVRQAACVGRVEIEARFALRPDVSPEAPQIVHTYRADELTYDIRTDGCPDYPGDDAVYTFSEGLHLSGTIPLTEENLGYVTFFPAYPLFSMQLPTDITYLNNINVLKGSYTSSAGTFPAETNVVFEALTIESDAAYCADETSPMYAQADKLDFCTEPTPCKASANVPMECYTDPQRYYVLPFEKSFAWDAPNEPGQEYHIADVEVSVGICEGCGP